MPGDESATLNVSPRVQERRWPARVALVVEWVIPRAVGVLFLYAGVKKFLDPTKTHRVFAFDGVPELLLAPLTHVVWVGEVALGLLLIIGIAKRRAIAATILVLFVYSLQLAYLIAAQNPPRDCACLDIFAKFASAKQQLVLGLVRNAVLAGALEWTRLRLTGRAAVGGQGLAVGLKPAPTEKTEDG